MANLSKSSSKKLNRNNDDIEKLSSSIAKHRESLITVAKLAALRHEKECIHSLRFGENERINSLWNTRRNVIRLSSDDVVRNAHVVNHITI